MRTAKSGTSKGLLAVLPDLIGLIVPGLAILFLFRATVANAHPVAQGALEIMVFSDIVKLRLRVSSEEVLVATTLMSSKDSHAPTPQAV